MATDNHTTIVGNLVEDPELRFTNTGIAVTNLRVAVTQRIQQDGEWRDGDTSFLRVNIWRGQAEHLADSLSGDGHRPAAAAVLGDPRGGEAVGHRAGGRRGRGLSQVGHGQGRALESARQRRAQLRPPTAGRAR
jgi:Single-strand binding protein family